MSAIGELSRLRRPAGRAAREKPRDTKAAMVFLAPWLLGLVLVTVLPIAASLYLSFTKYDLFNAPEFIGIDNYVRMAQDPRLAASLGVTFVYVLVGVPLAMGAALGIALL